jgi:YEATS domain-containing protein 4
MSTQGIIKTANGFYGQVVVGNSARFLGKKAAPEKTHEWTCYLRGVRGVDVSAWVARVDFHLHPSFAEPVRSLTAPPFEVTEKGWGEFEIAVHVHFHDAREEPVQFIHQLRLYEDVNVAPHPKRLVAVERVEDIIFSAQISPDFRAVLERCARPLLADSKKSLLGLLAPTAAAKKRRRFDVAVDETTLTAPEKAELATLKAADKKVVDHIKLLRTSYVDADAELETLRRQVHELQTLLDRRAQAPVPVGVGSGQAAVAVKQEEQQEAARR